MAEATRIDSDSAYRNMEIRYAEWLLPRRGTPMNGRTLIAHGSTMPRAQTIRGLERGLQVLQVLQSRPSSSLQDLYITTGISKPSLLRILHTLEQAGLVTRRLADGNYRLSTLTGVVRKRDRHDRVAEAAAPVLLRLCEKVRWPSDLFVPAGDCMERRETSRARSPFVVQSMWPDVVSRVGWLNTGVGRAYLAWCPETERERILRRLRKSNNPQDWLARDPKRLDRILSETRHRGYATRDPSHLGGTYDGPPRDDGLAAIVVALSGGARVYGSINILFIRTAFTIEDFAARHLADLQTAAHEIVDALRRPNPAR
jgi:IclR family transcriptional regulator, mhp operon transcriptional activator